MSRVAITVQEILNTGLSPTYGATSSSGNYFSNDGDTLLHIKNGSASPCTATVDVPATLGGQAVTDVSVTIPAGEERMIGRFPTDVFNQTDGTVYVDCSPTASVTAAVFKFKY